MSRANLLRSQARLARRRALATLLALAAFGCAKDEILAASGEGTPAADGGGTCGNLQLDPGEACDVASDGCVGCKVQSGWTCDDATCATVCGDGIIAGDESCDTPDGRTCDSSCWSGAKPEACDMTGYWIARQTNFSLDKALGAVQTSTNWYLYKLSQSGTDFVVERSIFCGIQVSGTVDVRLSPEGTRGLMYANPQWKVTSDQGGKVRRGTFAPNGASGCDFTMERMFYVRGGKASLLPATWDDTTSFDGLPALPASQDASDPAGPKPLDSDPNSLDDAVDTDGNGSVGVDYVISGIAAGVRDVVQRDWEQRQSDASHVLAENAIEMVAGVLFNNQENILHVSGCPAGGCGVLAIGSYPQPNAPDRITMRWLGTSLDDPRVARVATSEPGDDEEKDLAACAKVRAALPHDRSKK